MARLSEQVLVKLAPETAKELRRLAAQEDRSVSATARRLLAAGLAKAGAGAELARP